MCQAMTNGYDDVPIGIRAAAGRAAMSAQLKLVAIVRESAHPEDANLYQAICSTALYAERRYSVWDFDAETAELRNGLPVAGLSAAISIVCDRLMTEKKQPCILTAWQDMVANQ